MTLNDIEIIPEDREQRARTFFREGYNCTQSVTLAFADVVEALTGMNSVQIQAVTSGFGGGFARLREVCGAVSGMTFLAGVLSPAGPAKAGDSAAMKGRRDNYALVQEFATRFREENGSIVCRELLSLRAGQESPQPSERTPEYYKVRPCERVIGFAARTVAEKILESRAAGV